MHYHQRLYSPRLLCQIAIKLCGAGGDHSTLHSTSSEHQITSQIHKTENQPSCILIILIRERGVQETELSSESSTR